ncbi:hypothetical protein BJV82DRAFT_606605 [Fennellomyces sp. T-0311]|nr:hypothetical protein BJV82DRAFT_606605 [Fennellomyces sp. T-0311]
MLVLFVIFFIDILILSSSFCWRRTIGDFSKNNHLCSRQNIVISCTSCLGIFVHLFAIGVICLNIKIFQGICS